jgi:choline dehydrogenase-like flavoprotein
VPGQLPRATGLLLADGRRIKAHKEIVLSAGTMRSPQLLQLSGVDPAKLLARHSIPLIHDAPDVEGITRQPNRPNPLPAHAYPTKIISIF